MPHRAQQIRSQPRILEGKSKIISMAKKMVKRRANLLQGPARRVEGAGSLGPPQTLPKSLVARSAIQAPTAEASTKGAGPFQRTAPQMMSTRLL